jgi:hypothetical protein
MRGLGQALPLPQWGRPPSFPGVVRHRGFGGGFLGRPAGLPDCPGFQWKDSKSRVAIVVFSSVFSLHNTTGQVYSRSAASITGKGLTR